MRILLVNAPPKEVFGVVGQIYPPLGILYLISYARKHCKGELEFRALDGYHTSADEIMQTVVEFSPDIVGVSYTTQAATGAYDLIDRVKAHDASTIVVSGGPHPTLNPDEPFDMSKGDYVVVGEGEQTFAELIEKSAAGEPIHDVLGLVYRDAEGSVRHNALRPYISDLDDIPFPAREYLDMDRYPGYHYKQRGTDTSIMSARGCPFDCVYCSNPVWKTQKPWHRSRSVENYVDELEHVSRTMGIREFYDETDEFNANLSWAKAVCDEIIRRKLDIAWKVQMRADKVDDELAAKMAAAGCWLALFGVETGNDRTSYGIRKRIPTTQVESSLGIMKKHGIKTFALLMAFNVWEDEEGTLCYESVHDTQRTLDFVKKLIRAGKVDLMSWSLTTPYPGSKLYDLALKHDLIPGDKVGRWELWDSSSNMVMRLPGVTEEDWLRIQRRGKLLQAILLLKSGSFNARSLLQYSKKAYFMLRRTLLPQRA